MTDKEFWNQLTSFVIVLLMILLAREYVSHQLIESGIESYQTHTVLRIGANLILILVSYYFINKNGLLRTAGIKGTQLKKWYLLIFPLAYLVLLNALFMDKPKMALLLPNMGLLLIYSLSIGLSEELSVRGFIQSHLINRFGDTKKRIILSIFASSLFFGFIHLINFDKGIYGELSQVCFASFIGVMFGSLLVITKRLYPLFIIHALIDFVAKLDSSGVPVKQKIMESTSFENAILSTLLVLPCLIYGIFLMKNNRMME